MTRKQFKEMIEDQAAIRAHDIAEFNKNAAAAAAASKRKLSRFYRWSESTPIRTTVYSVYEYSDGETFMISKDHTSGESYYDNSCPDTCLAILNLHCAAPSTLD